MLGWLGNVARALVSASGRNDRAELKWWSVAHDPEVSLEGLASSGGERFGTSDAMLADALASKIDREGNQGDASLAGAGWRRHSRIRR